jgi:hypothetical protein
MSTRAPPLSPDTILCLFGFIHSTAGSGVGILARSILRNKPLPLTHLTRAWCSSGTVRRHCNVALR